MPNPEYPSIQTLRDTLLALQAKSTTTERFCRTWRDQTNLLAVLPPRYCDVMEDLLARMESGSHFIEESCSYSQDELALALTDWLDKVETKLSAIQVAAL
jgi:hypothetical protein